MQERFVVSPHVVEKSITVYHVDSEGLRTYLAEEYASGYFLLDGTDNTLGVSKATFDAKMTEYGLMSQINSARREIGVQ